VLSRVLVGAVILGTMGTAGEAWADGGPVTSGEFALYMDWKEGREDPRLEKFSEAAKMKKIAKNLGVPVTTLKEAVGKVEPVAATLGKDTEARIRKSLEKSPIKGRVLEIIVDVSQSHPVGAVKWRCGDTRDLDKEAVWVGWAIADGGPVLKTGAMWCVNGAGTKLFSAKASRDALARISTGSIERFASSRYIRLLEGVKRGPHK